MRSQPTLRYEYAATEPEPSRLREEPDAQRPGAAADLGPSSTAACKDKPLWTTALPLALSLLGLALAVVLWGLEYKVSLYQPHPNGSARVGVAKLWVGPRNTVFAKNNCIRKSAAPTPELHVLTTPCVSTSDSNDGTRCPEAELIPGIGCLCHPRTPRSPPSV